MNAHPSSYVQYVGGAVAPNDNVNAQPMSANTAAFYPAMPAQYGVPIGMMMPQPGFPGAPPVGMIPPHPDLPQQMGMMVLVPFPAGVPQMMAMQVHHPVPASPAPVQPPSPDAKDADADDIEAKAPAPTGPLAPSTDGTLPSNAEYDDEGEVVTYRVDCNGTQRWTDSMNRSHRGGDKPSIIYRSGTKTWRIHGKYFRASGGPTVVEADGTQKWVDKEGMSHRPSIDGIRKPTVIRHDGVWEFHTHGRLDCIMKP